MVVPRFVIGILGLAPLFLDEKGQTCFYLCLLKAGMRLAIPLIFQARHLLMSGVKQDHGRKRICSCRRRLRLNLLWKKYVRGRLCITRIKAG